MRRPLARLTLAVDPCAGLVALTLLEGATKMTLQRVRDDGSLGPAITFPTSGEVDFFDVVPVQGGLAVGWADGGSNGPAQQAHLAFVAVE